MVPLPQSFNIEQVDLLSDDMKSTFLEQNKIEAGLMETGDSLWRFTHSKKGKKFSLCWIDSATMELLMSIFTSWGDYSEATKKQVVKDNLGIMEDWFKGKNDKQDMRKQMLGWRLKITFKVPVVVYRGIIGPQKEHILLKDFGIENQKRAEARLGGLTQFIIPRFGNINSDGDNEYASIKHFAHL